MEKFIPYEKLSKKEKRKIDQARRQTWGELNPVTRKPENSKAYNRKKSQAWKRELPPTACVFSYPTWKRTVSALLPMGYPAESAAPLPLHTQFREFEDTIEVI